MGHMANVILVLKKLQRLQSETQSSQMEEQNSQTVILLTQRMYKVNTQLEHGMEYFFLSENDIK